MKAILDSWYSRAINATHKSRRTWHADLTFLPEPPLGSVLRCVLAPPLGGDTMWVSMDAAYAALSDKMQQLLPGLVAIHDTSRGFALSAYCHEEISDRDAGRLRSMSAEHPVVRLHPQTSRKGVFVNSHFTASLKGMKSAESATLLNFLYRHIELPDFTCRFGWHNNSVAMWVNRCTQYRAVADNRAAARRLERVMINGDRPFSLEIAVAPAGELFPSLDDRVLATGRRSLRAAASLQAGKKRQML